MDTGRTTAQNTGWYTESHTDAPADAFALLRAGETPLPTTAVGHAYESIKRALLVGEYTFGLRLAEERLGIFARVCRFRQRFPPLVISLIR